MEQKICMIKGANAGIGKAAAIHLAQAGHHVIMACRNPQKGATALQEVKAASGSSNVNLMIVDMSQRASIQALVQEFGQHHDRLDVLIHNAAIFDITQKSAAHTAEGIETFWATNHVGPVLLTDLLLPALERSDQGRIITVASKGLLAKPFLKIDLADPEFRQRKFTPTNAYYQSKRAQVMYTLWLVGQLQGTRITANCIRVPAVAVDLAKFGNLPGFMQRLYAMKSKFTLTPAQMAIIYAKVATDETLSTITGAYFDEKMNVVSPNAYARDPADIEAVMALATTYLDTRTPINKVIPENKIPMS